MIKRYETSNVFPEKKNIFKAFSLTKLDNLKVVVLGQDPYHGFGQAQGLSFQLQQISKNPPSMMNILKEINDDLGKNLFVKMRFDSLGNLRCNAFNTILTVEEGLPKSHHNLVGRFYR